MTIARCFNCEVRLPVGKPLEELIKERFPIFCCIECSLQFPNNGSPEFENRFTELSKRFIIDTPSKTKEKVKSEN